MDIMQHYLFQQYNFVFNVILRSVLLPLCISPQMLLSSTSDVPDCKHIFGLCTSIGLFHYHGFITLEIEKQIHLPQTA